MGHDLGEAVVVIALHPDHFDMTLGIRQFADEAEELPVLFFEPSEVEVGEDVAEQNKAAVFIFLQDLQRLASATHVRAEVQIREDQRVIFRKYDLRRHHSIVCNQCYEVMNWERNEGSEVTGR